MGISDIIANFILEEISEAEGTHSCKDQEHPIAITVYPSNKLFISTRFSPEHGYIVESRRGATVI
jgi:transcriptional regulator CtsR